MRKIYLLDCTLRDGGYINNWRFGESTIKGFCRKIANTGTEICEVGFIKGEEYDPEKSLFPDTASFKNVIAPKSDTMKYVGMLDMSAPIPMNRIYPREEASIDGIRVIFKKNKIDEAFEYCKYIQKQGYFVCVNFVGTDLYTDKEFIEGIEKFNQLNPFAVSIVDSFGLIKRKHFLRLVYLADNNLKPGIVLAYHAHNNLQQAFGNAEALVEMNLKRDILIDACVFGMGRGAGNLNLELFAEYMNENFDTSYQIEPMLEIMDEYLNDIYKRKSWGYSLPLYLSAELGCHPNYAIYLEEKNTLTEKSFREILKGIPQNDKASFSKDRAEKFYREYMEKYIDDRMTIKELSENLCNRKVMVLAPGKSLVEYYEVIKTKIDEETVVIALNFLTDLFRCDYVFSSNMRRFAKIEIYDGVKSIATSNIMEKEADYVVNFSSYSMDAPEIIDNSGLMLLKVLSACQVKNVMIAGMDGYSSNKGDDYFSEMLTFDFSQKAKERNKLIRLELDNIKKKMKVEFITPTLYDLK